MRLDIKIKISYKCPQLLSLYNIKFNRLKLLKDERSKNKWITVYNFIVNWSILGQALLFSHIEFYSLLIHYRADSGKTKPRKSSQIIIARFE